MSNIAIKVEGLSKKYILGNSGNWASKNSRLDFWALQDISFEIKEGESIGIVGKNGSGKSTLLKILSRITRPTTGRIEMMGRLASLLEVGTGFHQDLTGRENIYLNGTILGMSRSEVRSKFDDIVSFSGVDKFLDTPVKRYSSGMYVRLAFAVAAHLEPEILVVDEVLAVGDEEFQKKCIGKMDEVSRDGRTILFVSHNMSNILQLCSKSIFLSKGNLIDYGTSSYVVNKYLENTKIEEYINNNESASDIFIKKVFLTDGFSKKNAFMFDESIYLNIEISINNYSDSLQVAVVLLNNVKTKVFTSVHKLSNKYESCLKLRCKLPNNLFSPGEYTFDLNLSYVGLAQFDSVTDICNFNISDNGSGINNLDNNGCVIANCEWSVG